MSECKIGLAKELKDLPLYYFCGIGFLDKFHRREMLMHFNYGDTEPPIIDITKSPPVIRADFFQRIVQTFEEAGFPTM